MTKLSRGSLKQKGMQSVRTRTVVAFMCFGALISLLFLTPRATLDPVPTGGSKANLKNEFMETPPRIRSKKKVVITTELCFVTSIYGSSADISDKPLDVTELQRKYFPESKFYIFTNMQDMEAPGWIKVIRNFEFKRFITMSRWPKFMAWKEPVIQSCRTVFYMDGYITPTPENKKEIMEIAKAIQDSDVGMAQNPASMRKRLENRESENHTLVDELKYIIRSEKDIFSNMNKTAQWIRSQPNFWERNHCQVYDNCLIGYNPRCPRFQQATTEFWNLYASEEYTWRDQPFWCFTLNKLGIKPITMGGSRHDYFTIESTNKSPNKHKYDETHENSAHVAPKTLEDELAPPAEGKRARKKRLGKLADKLEVYQQT